VAAGRDPVTDHTSKAELRAFVSPFGFRPHSRVRPDELRQLAMPTLVIWGEYEPLGGVSVAQSLTDLIPDARLEVLPTGQAMARTARPDRGDDPGIRA
jgi:pimeloyl-ACP methyl ester carboxylesterase